MIWPGASLDVVGNLAVVDAHYPDRRYHFAGGAALHVAMAAAAAGVTTSITSVIGRDLEPTLRNLRMLGIDTRHVAVTGRRSCGFELTYDQDGQISNVETQPHAAEALTAHILATPATAAHRHICCRAPLDPRAVLDQIGEAPFSLDFFVSSANEQMRRVADFLPKATAVFVNQREFAALRSTLDLRQLPLVVVTDGPADCRVIKAGEVVAIASPPVTTPLEVTGAGDCLCGTFMARLLLGDAIQDALQLAVTAATESTLRPGGLDREG